jgi:YD repeat-containing protein
MRSEEYEEVTFEYDKEDRLVKRTTLRGDRAIKEETEK